jgi:hypothetical protein
MRNVALVVVILLVVPVVRAADIQMVRPHIYYLSDNAAAIACKSASRRACTTIVTEFVCGCAPAGDQWGVHTRIIATPSIYTTTQAVMRHELEHISDIRSSLNEYVDSLALHMFQSETNCLSFVNGEVKMFPETLKLMQRITTIKRDGVRFASGSSH